MKNEVPNVRRNDLCCAYLAHRRIHDHALAKMHKLPVPVSHQGNTDRLQDG